MSISQDGSKLVFVVYIFILVTLLLSHETSLKIESDIASLLHLVRISLKCFLCFRVDTPPLRR